MDKFTRLLSLVALLEQRSHPQTFESIKEQLRGEAYPQTNPETARRSFERDKDDLLSMGVPLVAAPFADDPSNTGYTIRRERSEVSDPGLTPAELAALRMAARAMALRHEGVEDFEDATDGLRKFGGLAGGDGETGQDLAAGAGAPVDTLAEIRLDANISEVFGGIVDRRPVGFGYNGQVREVLPRHLRSLSGNWYLTCDDLGTGETRTYRLDRIEGSVLPLPAGEGGPATGSSTGSDPLPSGRFRPWEFGSAETVTVQVALDAAAAAVALAEHPDLEVTAEDPDRTVFNLDVRSPEGLWNWLLRFMDRAVVLAPQHMREAYLAHVSTLTAEQGAPR